MTQENLLNKLNFEGEDIYLDGKIIFSVPHIKCASRINVLGIPQNGKRIYFGTGECCYGFQGVLEKTEKGEDDFRLESLVTANFNVFDIIPVIVDYKKTGFGNGDAVLTTGYGCAGAGVKLTGVYYPDVIEVVSRDEFRKIEGIAEFTLPILNVNQQNGTISLDFYRTGYRLKPGRSVDPRLPRTPDGTLCLIDDAFEHYVSQDIIASKDLTSHLKELGLDIENTMEQNSGYIRMKR